MGYRIDEAALRRAVTDTRCAMRAARAAGWAAPAGQVVTGAIPQEPPGFIERQALDDLAGAAGHGQVTVVCAVMGLR